MQIRKTFLKLHLWVGLAAAILIILTAGSGAILVFEPEMERWLHPSWGYVTPQGQPLPLSRIAESVKTAFPKTQAGNYFLPQEPDIAMMVLANNGTRVYVNQYTGQVLGSRAIPDSLTFSIHQFHTRLLIPNAKVILNGKGKPPTIIRNRIGSTIVGWGTVTLLFMAITGLVIWFPRNIWRLTKGAGWRRLNFDLHSVLGLYGLIFLVVLAGTGVMLSFDAPSDWLHKVLKTPDTEEAPAVEFQRGVAFIEPDRALDAARKALPDAAAYALMTPRAPNFTYNISFRFPEDRTPIGRSHVLVNPYTAEVMQVDSSRQAATAYKILYKMRPLHTGDIFGWPSRIAMLLASISIVLESITGATIWIARTFKKRQAVGALEVEPSEEEVVA